MGPGRSTRERHVAKANHFDFCRVKMRHELFNAVLPHNLWPIEYI
jgi:hypothetical protein